MEVEVRALRGAVAVLVVLSFVPPVVATLTGVRDGTMVNGDEAVAALLPVEVGREGPFVLFPGNAYQGVLEVPAYAALWAAAGPHELPFRLLHQAMWTAAVAAWAAAALEVARRGGASTRARWWGALAVAGLLGVTSVVGWPVWFRIYPGYHLGALLGALGVLVALRLVDTRRAPASERAQLRGWALAGLLAGLAVYAQPMHAAGVVGVGLTALLAARDRPASSGIVHRARPVLVSAAGAALGVLPLVAWNLRNGMAILDSESQPVQHPEWGYPQRLANTVRLTGRVLWGDGSAPLGGVPRLLATAVAVIGVVVLAAGLWALWRWRPRSWPLVGVVAVSILGLPLLSSLSLETDQRYAVGWWPGLVVLVAAGAAGVVDALDGRAAVAACTVVAAAVAVQLVVVVAGAWPVVSDRTGTPSAEAATRDMADDLRRCGVDVVAGDYWAVYPAVWGSDARLRTRVTWGPERLAGTSASADARRVAVAPTEPARESVRDVRGAAAAAAPPGRGGRGWVVATHPGTGVRLAIERTAEPLPEGCIGPSGFVEG